jgi:hypothetical protein
MSQESECLFYGPKIIHILTYMKPTLFNNGCLDNVSPAKFEVSTETLLVAMPFQKTLIFTEASHTNVHMTMGQLSHLDFRAC